MKFKQFLKEQFYNDKLNPRLWNDQNELDPALEKKLMEIANNFADDVGVTQYIDDIQLTGSLANYNYTKHSDFDVHILLPYNKINKDIDLVKDALDGKRWVWNEKHKIIIRDHEVELYFQDSKEPHIASGLYSLKNSEWLKEPKFDPPEIDNRDVSYKADQLTRDIKILESKVNEAKGDPKRSEELQKITDRYRSKIAKMRKDSLHKDGEFGIGNLVFKTLRNNGSMERLIDISNQSYDQIYAESDAFKKYQEAY